jgi:hypothetical protein
VITIACLLLLLAATTITKVRITGAPYNGVWITTRGNMRWFYCWNSSNTTFEIAVWNDAENTTLAGVAVGRFPFLFFPGYSWSSQLW